MSNKNKKSDKGYRIIRLVNGEKLIAKISGSNSKKLFLERPMVINGIKGLGGGSAEMSRMIRKEFIALTNWIEFSFGNVIDVPRDFILTISIPNSFIISAYETQKQYDDEGGTLYTNFENNNVYYESSDSLQYEIDEELMDSINADITNIVNDIISGKMLQEDLNDWDEEDIDKNREDYGTDLNDWSPYPDDYLGD